MFNQPIISKRIRTQRFFTTLSLVFLLVFSGLLLTSNYFNQSAKAVDMFHDGKYIAQGDTSYDDHDIVINDGTVTIDGYHRFSSLTINDSATLTSSSYNRYSLDESKSDLDKAFKVSNQKYAFAVRGFINTIVSDVNTKYKYAAANANTTTKTPQDFDVDDAMSLEFYPATDNPAYDPTLFDSSHTPLGYAFSKIGASPAVYTDADSTDTNRYIPFEARFYNNSGSSSFGISYCDPATNCSQVANHHFLNLVASDSDFGKGTITVPELKTVTAWQGTDASLSATVYSDYNTFKNYFDGKFTALDHANYNPTYFFQANNYDLAYDLKVYYNSYENVVYGGAVPVPYPNAPAIESGINWHSTIDDPNVGSPTYNAPYIVRDKSFFSPVSNLNSPFVYASGDGFDSGYPVLSLDFLSSLTKKIPTELSISGTFSIPGTGRVDLNGKGFGPSTLNDSGTGQGFGVGVAGASHAGRGGGKTVSDVYDNISDVEPLMPGSGTSISGTYSNISNLYAYGGGYLAVKAKKIDLSATSSVLSSAVGGGIDGPLPPAAGGSGGAVVLEDDDPASNYSGSITASGGSSRSVSNTPVSIRSGGGGGHIFILSGKKVASFTDRSRFNVTGGFGSVRGVDGVISILNRQIAYTIRKELIPVNRPATAVGDKFNPYGLMPNDEIQVKLTVVFPQPGMVIKDDFLDGGGYICDQPTKISPADAVTTTSGNISWIYSSNSTFTYNCKVRKK